VVTSTEPGFVILFEDNHLMAVSKAAGVVSHPCYKHPDGTLYNALLDYLRSTAPEGDPAAHPRLLQRLDKGTSGVMLVSKTMLAHAGVIRAMTKGTAGGVRKEYLAVVHGVPDPPEGEITLRLRRDPEDTRRVAASETEGKESVTRYRVLCSRPSGERPSGLGSQASDRSSSLVVCSALTGRMHQIRVHLAARGWPIVGDPVYGPGEFEGAPPLGRQALHAWRVSLAHPMTGAPLAVTAPIPPDLGALLDSLGLAGPPC